MAHKNITYCLFFVCLSCSPVNAQEPQSLESSLFSLPREEKTQKDEAITYLETHGIPITPSTIEAIILHFPSKDTVLEALKSTPHVEEIAQAIISGYVDPSLEEKALHPENILLYSAFLKPALLRSESPENKSFRELLQREQGRIYYENFSVFIKDHQESRFQRFLKNSCTHLLNPNGISIP